MTRAPQRPTPSTPCGPCTRVKLPAAQFGVFAMTGGAVAAPPQPTPDTDNRHLSYLHTDADLPPVAVIDRSPISTRHKIFFALIAVTGAVAWAIIAFARGETVNAVWFVVAAICTYVIGYRFYARLIEAKI